MNEPTPWRPPRPATPPNDTITVKVDDAASFTAYIDQYRSPAPAPPPLLMAARLPEGGIRFVGVLDPFECHHICFLELEPQSEDEEIATINALKRTLERADVIWGTIATLRDEPWSLDNGSEKES